MNNYENFNINPKFSNFTFIGTRRSQSQYPVLSTRRKLDLLTYKVDKSVFTGTTIT